MRGCWNLGEEVDSFEIWVSVKTEKVASYCVFGRVSPCPGSMVDLDALAVEKDSHIAGTLT